MSGQWILIAIATFLNVDLTLLLGVTSNSYVELGLLLQDYVWLKTSNVSCLAYYVRN